RRARTASTPALRIRRRTRPRVRDPRCSQALEYLGEVLVAAAREPDEDQVGVEVARAGERVRGLERGEEALRSRQILERGECLLVGGDAILGPASVAQEGVLGA